MKKKINNSIFTNSNYQMNNIIRIINNKSFRVVDDIRDEMKEAFKRLSTTDINNTDLRTLNEVFMFLMMFDDEFINEMKMIVENSDLICFDKDSDTINLEVISFYDDGMPEKIFFKASLNYSYELLHTGIYKKVKFSCDGLLNLIRDTSVQPAFVIIIDNIISNYTIDNDIIKSLFNNNLFFIYRNLVTTNKINVKKEHFDIYLKRENVEMNYFDKDVIFFLEHKVIPNEEHFNLIIKLNHRYNSVQILLEYGYVPTLKNVKDAFKKHIYIKNFYKYDIIPDDELFEMCIKSYGYYDYFDKYDLTQEKLEHLFEKCQNLDMIKLVLKNHKSLINKKCIDNAYKMGNNEIIRYLITEYKILD